MPFGGIWGGSNLATGLSAGKAAAAEQNAKEWQEYAKKLEKALRKANSEAYECAVYMQAWMLVVRDLRRKLGLSVDDVDELCKKHLPHAKALEDETRQKQ